MNTILFLNENSISKPFTTATISGKELRLRASLPQIEQVIALARFGEGVKSGNSSKRTSIEKKISIHHLPSACPYYLSTICLFFYGFYLTWKYKPILLEAESPLMSGVAAILLGKLFHKPTLIEVRVSYQDILNHKLTFIPLVFKAKLLTTLTDWVLTRATVIIANSETIRAQLEKEGLSSIVINPGLQHLPKRKRKQKTVPPWRLGFLGRLVPEKGVDLLIKAVHVIKQEQPQTQLSLTIAGEGKEKERLQAIVKQYSLENTVSFPGKVNNYQFMQTIDILINPNTVKAPLEMVNAEAAAMGVPVICFGHGLVPETVLHLRTGLKIPQPSVKQLTQAILTLMEDKNLYQKMSNYSPNFAKNRYDFDLQINKLRQVYQDLGLI